MNTILVDHDIEGPVLTLWRALAAEGWLEICPLQLVTFVQVGLPVDSSDRIVWQFAQAQGMMLLTHNRNMKDERFPRTNYSRGKHDGISACAHHWQGGAPQRKSLSRTLCRPPGRNWPGHRALLGGWAPFHSIVWTPHYDLQQCSIQGRKKPHTCHSDSAGRETRWLFTLIST